MSESEINWVEKSCEPGLSEGFIREHQDKLGWEYISIYQKLSEDFIREFQDRVNWFCISRHQKLSEEFIREYQDNVDWPSISCYQDISEDFIREFQDKVDWNYISVNRKLKLSEEFYIEFIDRISFFYLSSNDSLSYEFKRRLEKYFLSKNETKTKQLDDKITSTGQPQQPTISDIEAFAYRIARQQIIKNLCGKLPKVLLKKIDNDSVNGFEALLSTEFGKGILSVLLGYMITNTLSIKEDNRIKYLAKELKLEGSAIMGSSVLENIIPTIQKLSSSLPENKGKIQQRISTDTETAAQLQNASYNPNEYEVNDANILRRREANP